MTKKRVDTPSGRTTHGALKHLADTVAELVAKNTLDTRCAVKLLGRLEKENDAVRDVWTKDQSVAVKDALRAADDAVRTAEANLLVSANAALRADET